MLKALFLDLDETLCDTTGANLKALDIMAAKADELLPSQLDSQDFAQRYLKGIYRELDQRYQALLLPVTHEENFRLDLIQLILSDLGIDNTPREVARTLQETFDNARTECFDFFAGIKQLLLDLRHRFTLVVITNGPEFSQVVKVEAVNLHDYVDHIIIGGQEPAQKPDASIFEKALRLANCSRNEVIHIGDSLSADIAGANNAGLDSVWISHNQDLPDDSTIRPTHIIENPFQLRDLLETLS